jgi:16S rRNA (adenine1518-N6/adenine1519-N6)-dimethyltransferase
MAAGHRSPRDARPARVARKRFGQHFLEPAWVRKVVGAITPRQTDTFLEIGPGRGELTRPLAAAAGLVVACEIDRDLAAHLRANSPPNLKVVQGDFLDMTAERLIHDLGVDGKGPRPVRVAGNLPYNVASPILFKLGELYSAGVPLTDATVMLQREVAERLLASVGTRRYGVLTVLVRLWADVERLLVLPPGAFRPSPKVHSAVVRLRFHPPRPLPLDSRTFVGLTQAVFTRRRKTIANALLAYPVTSPIPPATALERAGIDAHRRPETLEIADFVRLADVLAPAPPG